MSFFDKIAALFCKHGHASMLFVDNDKERAQRSHINPDIIQDDFDIHGYLYSDCYKIDVTALISEEHQKVMEKIYGSEWKGELATKFQMIENQLHCNLYSNFGGLQASDSGEQRKAGLADIIPFGHKQLQANDFNEIHNIMSEYYASQQNPNMLCSEFCARVIIATLVELENQIKQDVRVKKKSGEEIEENILNQNIVKIPFGIHENLHRMHPDRLLSSLMQYNCISKYSAKTIDQFIGQVSLAKDSKVEFVERLGQKVST